MLAIWLVFIVGVCVYSNSKYKKGYIYSFILLFSILPNSFGIGFKGQTLSFNYLLIFYLAMGAVFANSGKLKIRFNKFQKQWITLILLGILVQMGVNFATGGSSIFEILIFLFSDVFIFLFLANEIETKEEIEKCLQYYCFGCCVLVLLAIIKIVFGIDAVSCLFINNDNVELAKRFGILRLSSTYNSITFSYYCAFAIPIFCYQYSKHKNIFWLFMVALDIVAIAFTGTRGAFVLVLLYFLVFLVSKRKITAKVVLRIVVMTIVFCLILYLVVNTLPNVYQYVLKYVNATLKVFDTGYVNYEINNNNATNSRLMQLSVAQWLIKNGKIIFGIGFSAYNQGKIAYYMNGKWVRANAIDVGYAAMLASGGLITIMLYLSLFLIPLKRLYKKIREVYSLEGVCVMLSIFYLIANLESVFYRDNAAIILLTIIYGMLFLKKKGYKYE